MQALICGLGLQWKMDMRSKSLLITYYLIPLVFFVFMGGIFTSVMPEMKVSLIPSMIVMGVSMGAFLGLPLQLAETYRSDIKKVYQTSGIPLFFPALAMGLSAFIHLFLMALLITAAAPLIFRASRPANLPLFVLALAIFILVSVCLGTLLGLAVTQPNRLSMIGQLLFLPSIMLSGIMFPASILPEVLQKLGKLFPAYYGFRLMLESGFKPDNLLPLAGIGLGAAGAAAWLLRRLKVG